MTPLGAKMAGEKEDDRDQNRAVWPCVYILHGALSPLCGADSAEELVCLYVRGRRLAEGTPAVTSHSRGLEAKDGAPGKSLHHRVCFLVLFWPWSAHRKERKKVVKFLNLIIVTVFSLIKRETDQSHSTGKIIYTTPPTTPLSPPAVFIQIHDVG